MRQARRGFRPSVAGLEGRQLLSAVPITNVVTLHDANQWVISGLVMDARGDLFGSASGGGEGSGKADATVFEVPAGSKSVETLASFDGRAGSVISGLSIDAKGDLFGTIGGQGGAIGNGSAFVVPAGSKSAVTLASFNGYDGQFPGGVSVDPAGNLFGTAAVGGPGGVASAFEIPADSGAVVPIAPFPGPAPAPKGLAIDGQGNLYGTDAAVDAAGTGAIYAIPRGTNAAVNLATFPGYDGAGISSPTIDAQGNLYGTTIDGGQFGAGTVYEVARGSGAVTTLATFNQTTGTEPDPAAGVVVDAQGDLFGTTEYGGAYGFGTVFEVARGSGVATTLASFKGSNGTLVHGLTLDGQGNLDVSINGSGDSGGTVDRLALGAQAAAAGSLPAPSAVSSASRRK